jgi:hypothetical protein
MIWVYFGLAAIVLALIGIVRQLSSLVSQLGRIEVMLSHGEEAVIERISGLDTLLEAIKKNLSSIGARFDQVEQELLDATAKVENSMTSDVSAAVEEIGGGLGEIDERIAWTEIGKEAAVLYEQGTTYLQIALQLCPERAKLGHHCGKVCASRIRQASRPFLST